MFLTHALRAIYRAVVAAVTGDALWKYVTLLISGTPPAVTFISDASTNGNVLTLNGDTRPSNFNPYTPGYYSNYFDGTGDYLTTPSNAAFSLGTGNFTIEGWVYMTAYSVGSCLFGTTNGGTTGYYINLGADLNTLRITSNASGTWADNITVSAGNGIPLNQWVHVAFVRNGANITLYKNGVNVATASGASAYNYSSPNNASYVGFVTNGVTTQYLTGYISNLRVVKGTALYTANFTPSTTPLTAISGTSLLTCQSNRLIDNSLNNFVITKNGDTTVSGFIPFTPPTSVTVNNLYSTYFDGTGDYLSVPTSTNLNLTADFTVEMWANATATTNAADQVFNYGNFIFMLYHVGTTWTVEVGNGTSNLFTLSGTASLNAWHHFAITRSGNTYTFWIDGVSAATTTNTNAPSTSGSTLYIGRRSSNNDQYFTGYISNFRIIKGTGLYTIPFPTSVPTAPLTAIANTSLLTCQNSTLIDNSTNAFAITSAGDARPVAQSPFTQTTTAVNTTYLGSGCFDGAGDILTIPSNEALNPNTGAFTIEMWIYPLVTVSGAGLFTAAPAGADTRYSITYYGTTGFGFARSTAWIAYTSTVPAINSWSHLAVSRDATGAVRLFLNGVAQTLNGTANTTVTDTGTFLTTAMQIGYWAGYFNGYISNVRMVKGTAVYTSNFDVPAQPLTAVTNTQLLTLQTNQPAANKQFVDNSGNNFLITQAGNTTQGTFSPYGANWSNYFDATGDYLNTPSNVAFAFGTGDYTVECWAYPIPAGKISRLFQYSDNVDGIEVNSNAGTYAVGYINYYNGSGSTASSTAVVSNNAWSHIAVVRLSGTVRVYVNGVLALTQATTPNTTTARSLAIGGSSSDATFFSLFYGYISNCRVVKGTAVYLTAFPSTVPTTPLTPITNTSLLTCQSPSLIDNSANAFAITKNGDTSVQRFSPFSPVTQTPISYSGYFAGTTGYIAASAGVGVAPFALGSVFTIECWIYPTVNQTQDLFRIGAFEVGYSSASSWGVAEAGVAWRLTTTTMPTLNAWNHLAIVRTGTSTNQTQLYLNGVSVATGTYAPALTSNQDAYIGAYSDGTYPFTGHISNVRIVKGVAVYTGTFTLSTSNLTATQSAGTNISAITGTATSLLTCQSPTFIDNSTNAFAITQSGSPAPRAYNPFGYTLNQGQSYTPALYGSSAYFDGTGDYLTTPSNAAFALGTGNFTIEAWAYITATPTGNFDIFTTANGTYPNTAYRLCITNALLPEFYDGGATPQTSSVAIALNTWNHIAATRTGTAVKLYVNGVQTASGTSSNNFTNAVGYIGKTWNGYYYFGYISDVRVVKGTSVYTSNFVPPSAPLTATAGTTLLLNMDKGAAVDSSRINDLETVGDAKVTYETPYAGSYYSNFFDGTGDYLTAPSNIALAFGTGDYTMECWIYPTTTNYGRIFEFSSNSDNVDIDMSTGAISYYNGGSSTSSASGVIRVNSWSHIALVRSSGTAKIYVNGVLALTQPVTPNTTIARVLYIAGASNLLFAGYISNLRVVKGTAVYLTAFPSTVPTAPLTAIANTSLLTCQSKSFVDNSSNNFTLTRNGDVAVKSQNPFQKNTYSSMFFDGTGDYLFSPSTQFQNYNFGTGDFTIECWLYQTVFSLDKTIIASVTTWSTSVNFYFATRAGSPNILLFRGGDSIPITLNGNTGITASTWTHVAVSRASGVTRMFVGGVLQTATHTGSVNIGNSVQGAWIGAWGSAINEPMTGYIADLRITKSARYTGTFPLPTEPLLTS